MKVAIKLAGNPAFHARSKHIETHYHFVREKVLSQDVELQKIHTNKHIHQDTCQSEV